MTGAGTTQYQRSQRLPRPAELWTATLGTVASFLLTLPPLATVVLKGSRLLLEEEHPVGSVIEVEAAAK
jgi:hypothetical protein